MENQVLRSLLSLFVGWKEDGRRDVSPSAEGACLCNAVLTVVAEDCNDRPTISIVHIQSCKYSTHASLSGRRVLEPFV